MSVISVSDAARQFRVPPRVISDLFYARRLDDERCPIIGRQRLIPVEYLDAVAIELRRAGHLPPLPKQEARRAG